MENTIAITSDQVLPIIMRQGGDIFSVDFIKKDGSKRTVTGRLGVHKHTTGAGLKFSPLSRGMIPVWETTEKNRKDEKDKGYRMVTLSRVTGLRAEKKSYIVK